MIFSNLTLSKSTTESLRRVDGNLWWRVPRDATPILISGFFHRKMHSNFEHKKTVETFCVVRHAVDNLKTLIISQFAQAPQMTLLLWTVCSTLWMSICLVCLCNWGLARLLWTYDVNQFYNVCLLSRFAQVLSDHVSSDRFSIEFTPSAIPCKNILVFSKLIRFFQNISDWVSFWLIFHWIPTPVIPYKNIYIFLKTSPFGSVSDRFSIGFLP